MECRKALTLMSPYLDGALPKNEETALMAHVAACETCARELALQQRLSTALQELGRAEVQAPPELCGLVMGRLRSERRAVLAWIPATWRKTVAAAATLLLVAGGSAGVINGIKMASNGNNVALNPPAQETSIDVDGLTTVARDGDGIPAQEDPTTPSGSSTPGDLPGENSAEDVSKNEGTPSAASEVTGANTAEVAPGVRATAIAGPSMQAEPRALLNGGLKVTSTMLKVSVGNLTEARAKAVALAAGAGAKTQVFPEQAGDKKIVVVRVTASSDSAPQLIAGLTGLGTLVDRQDESRDITSVYNETVVQYRDIQARINSAGDAAERQLLESQAASYNQQLDAWEAEAGKRVIMLWLEGN